jgi:amino acid transporter
MSPDAVEPKKPRRGPLARWLIYIGLFLVGFVLYWASDLIFERYITNLLSWIIILAMMLAALVIWIIDERRIREDDDLG